jgi:hypothetical protein
MRGGKLCNEAGKAGMIPLRLRCKESLLSMDGANEFVD